jgi:hypothetical protein
MQYGRSTSRRGTSARTGRVELACTPSLFDLVLMGLAAHRISRLLSKSKVGTPIRAPFTRFDGRPGLQRSTTSRPARAGAAASATC